LQISKFIDENFGTITNLTHYLHVLGSCYCCVCILSRSVPFSIDTWCDAFLNGHWTCEKRNFSHAFHHSNRIRIHATTVN